MNKKLTSVDKNSFTFGWRRSIRWRLIITLGVVIVITLFGISLGVFTYIRQTEARFWQDRQREATGLAADVVSGFLERQLQGLVLLGSVNPDVLTSQAVDNLLQQSPDLLEIVRLDEDGAILASAYRDEPLMTNLFTASQSVWFLESRAGRQYLGEIELSSAKDPYLIISVPASDDGVAVARLSADVLWQVVLELQPGETGQAYLVNQDGLIIAHTNKEYSERYTSLKDKPNFASLMEVLNSEWHGSYVNLEGEQVEAATSPVEGFQWTAVTEITSAETTATSQTALIILGSGIIFVGLLMMLLTSVVLERTIVRPLQHLQTGADRVGQGEVQYRIDMPQRDELGQVAAAFNQMTAEVQDVYNTLESRVAERTQRLGFVAVLSERLTAILELDQLLVEMVNQVKLTFDYYHVHIYLIDNQQKKLTVAAGTGEAGAEMTAKGHSIPLDAPTSLVARAARTQEFVTVDNVRQAEDWLPNSLLPDTYAELAVPIVLDGRLVGVLDIQEDEIGGLDESDVNTLRLLANQTAIAIRNARQFTEVELALKSAQAAQGKYLEQAWASSSLRQQEAEYLYIRPDSDDLSEEMLTSAEAKALDQAQGSLVPVDDDETAPKSFIAPVRLGSKTIGALQIYNTDSENCELLWNEDDLAVVEAVIDQVAQTAENLRLFDEIRERASRESLVSNITDKLRRAPDLETLMQIGVTELSKVLQVDRTYVQFGNAGELRRRAAKVTNQPGAGSGGISLPLEVEEIGEQPVNGTEAKEGEF